MPSPAIVSSSLAAWSSASRIAAVWTLAPASPSRSTAYTVRRSVRAAMFGCHETAVPFRPCSNMIGTPSAAPKRYTRTSPKAVRTSCTASGAGSRRIPSS